MHNNLPTKIKSIVDNLNLINSWNKANELSYHEILALNDRLHQVICKSPNRPIKEMNFIEFFNPDEPDTSHLLKMIFSYRDKDGKYIIFHNFAESFLKPIGLNIEVIKQPDIHREKWHIDLLIKETGKYAIIFENKLKGADFQRNQLARYIQTVRELGYKDEQIFIIILPQTLLHIDDIRKSVWHLPKDWRKPNKKKKCAWLDDYRCWCDGDCVLNKSEEMHCSHCQTNLKHLFRERTIITQKDFANWMQEEEQRIEARELNVRSGLLQMADYLNGLYKTRFNHQLNMEIKDFLRSELKIESSKEGWKQLREKLSELYELEDGVLQLRREISHDLIEQWYNELKSEWPNLTYEPRISFGLMLQGKIWCGCKFDDEGGDMGNDEQPFWGFLNQSAREQPSSKQIAIVESILNYCGLSGEEELPWIKWNNTLSGASRCRELFKAAKELGYLE